MPMEFERPRAPRRAGEVMQDAGHLLPKQAILDNFVHHNPWEMLQNMNFFDALAYVPRESAPRR